MQVRGVNRPRIPNNALRNPHVCRAAAEAAERGVERGGGGQAGGGSRMNGSFPIPRGLQPSAPGCEGAHVGHTARAAKQPKRTDREPSRFAAATKQWGGQMLCHAPRRRDVLRTGTVRGPVVEARALGKTSHYLPQPQRGCSLFLGSDGCNPVGVVEYYGRYPRVARSSQPWAESHSPVGANKGRTLATLRDTLLPKLLSGELSVAAAAKRVEARARTQEQQMSNHKEHKERKEGTLGKMIAPVCPTACFSLGSLRSLWLNCSS